jgi:predicted transcriptional regulator
MVRISVELPEEVAERLRRIAAAQATTAEAVAAAAISSAMTEETEFDDDPALQAAIAEAEADVAAGRVHPAEEVFARLDAIVAAALVRKGM